MRHSYINNMWIVTTKNVQKAFLLKFTIRSLLFLSLFSWYSSIAMPFWHLFGCHYPTMAHVTYSISVRCLKAASFLLLRRPLNNVSTTLDAGLLFPL